MNAVDIETQLYRSEAFAEDVLDLVARAPVVEPARASPHWPAKAVPLAAALFGGAFTKPRPAG